MTQGLLYTLWDLGLTVGHSVRSLPDCVAMARTDFASRTSMQEARYVVGDRRLFQRFRRVLAENVYRKDFGQFLETALAERDQRYRKFGGSPYMGEPTTRTFKPFKSLGLSTGRLELLSWRKPVSPTASGSAPALRTSSK